MDKAIPPVCTTAALCPGASLTPGAIAILREQVMAHPVTPVSAQNWEQAGMGKEEEQNNGTSFYSSQLAFMHGLQQCYYALSLKANWKGSVHRPQKHPCA